MLFKTFVSAALCVALASGDKNHHGHAHLHRYKANKNYKVVGQPEFDLDGNGFPDVCFVNGPNAACLLPNGSWVEFPTSVPPVLKTTSCSLTSTSTAGSQSALTTSSLIIASTASPSTDPTLQTGTNYIQAPSLSQSTTSISGTFFTTTLAAPNTTRSSSDPPTPSAQGTATTSSLLTSSLSSSTAAQTPGQAYKPPSLSTTSTLAAAGTPTSADPQVSATLSSTTTSAAAAVSTTTAVQSQSSTASSSYTTPATTTSTQQTTLATSPVIAAVPTTTSAAAAVTTSTTITLPVTSLPAYTAPATSASASPSSSASSAPSVTLPSCSDWATGNSTLWKVEYVGRLGWTQEMVTLGLGGDKCRTGTVGGQVIWNCGDMMCPTVNGKFLCGFSMGPAMYGTEDVMTVNTNNITNINDNTFAQPSPLDPQPVAPYTQWGMDTSNVVEINSTHGVAFAFAIWRGQPTGVNDAPQGVAAVSVTLGAERPIASRPGPLLSNGESLQLGLLAILRAGDYVYTYSIGGPQGIIVGRVPATDAVFDPKQHQFLNYATQTWDTPGCIPAASDMTYGLKTSEPSFYCASYGSAFWFAAWGKYVILCNQADLFTQFYTADAPEGPFSGIYSVLGGVPGYGSMAHIEYGNPGELYFSQGPNGIFDMFKLTVGGS